MYKAIINNNEFEVDFSSSDNKAGTINNSKFEIDSIDLKEGHFNILKNNKSYNAEIVSFDADEKTYKIKYKT
jgi:hypothetical protein